MTIDEITDRERDILKELDKYSPAEVRTFLQQMKKPAPVLGQSLKLGTKNVRGLFMSDTHGGHKAYREDLMELAHKVAKRRKVDFVAHAGDICDGLYTHRPGHFFELDHIGADDQVNFMVDQLSGFDVPFYFITGNHTRNTFYKNAGYEVGFRLEEKIKDSKYLGNGHGRIELSSGVTIDLLHPDGGTAYAISYKPQKWAEALEGGTKPDSAFIGHFHKAEYLFYRNIHIFQAGCLEAQTPFMKGKGLSAHTGFWVVTYKTGDKGINSITPEFFPGY
jgi:predicted phosphodiesterase